MPKDPYGLTRKERLRLAVIGATIGALIVALPSLIVIAIRWL